MLGLRNYFSKGDEVQTLLDGIDGGLKEQLVSGLSGSARMLLIASLYNATKRSTLIITHNLYQAQKLYEDLTDLVDPKEVFLYPVNELISSEIAIASPELRGQRIEVLNHWSESQSGIVIAPISGVRRYLPPKEVWRKGQLTFHIGDDINLEETLKRLVAIGYERTAMVATPGEFSVRGGIIDIYPLTESHPVRIELFDTEVDSIRYFNIENQRSEDKTDSVTIGPAEEVILFPENYEQGATKLEAQLGKTLKKVKDNKAKENLNEHINYEIGQLKRQEAFQGLYKYMSFYYENPASLLDYMPENGTVVFDEVSRVQEMSSDLDKEEAEWQTALLKQGEIVADLSLSRHYDDLFGKIKQSVIYLSLFLRHVPHTNPENIINVSCKSMQNFHGQMNVLKGELERWKKGKFAVVFLAPNQERAKRFERVLDDYEIDALITDPDAPLTHGSYQILIGDLSGGFELPMQKLAVLTEAEVFTTKTRKPRRTQKLSNAERIKTYTELKVGDYVVHVNHGIGKYLGIKTLEINGIHKDYLYISYSGNDNLYVPVDQIDQVQKYVASEGKEPKIYKLGGNDWKKVKRKVQSSVQDIADDLIKLYAEREASKGHRYPKDDEAQREFEASFPYQETEDQLRAIQEIKEDMEKERPMDRLLCGDVGYGKTEVAVRAAFKAIMDGKQVAILVPTTILAQQHFETLRERFADHPINIGLLSRFRSRKEQNETLKGLKNGSIDVVVGTHRILSKDIKYNDLGLLIVDEEQRFGVTHKEKIKRMKANVDVLTLTATPIPRTLHMSLLGVRDLSVIETPPENRFPVQTYVAEFSAALAREAIERELARGGQVYFLYNRVEDIDRMTEQIRSLVPDAKVAFAHGQMSESELESVMIDFLDGNYDVLVSTTIIETGVDIPNVNTLIVYNGDKMGLSQLYQLRGRVGRSNRVAYAYITYQRDKVLTEVAEKRLQAIKEFTELGSGFKIAMRDLSIRGAGNLLGAEQHGFIDSVGFDLYSEMLREAIEERKGNKPKETPFSVEIEIDVDAYIPQSYIQDERQKIDMYKRFKGLKSLKDVIDLQDEMLDRFGDFPEEVEYLFSIARIKEFARRLKVESVTQRKQDIVLTFSEDAREIVKGEDIFEIANEYGRKVSLGADGNKVKLAVKGRGMEMNEQVTLVEKILEKITKTGRKTRNAG
ncbi:transcription-repair coupling factor [Pseudalkalibacillus caeni]|uniref:Transcription-repair-coupling factor n=1 Tax=Exobacillus caeni TaxID=2574798 RepID=A0A5R9F5N7_9BACL|nr:transcription-repair coupling factor [Pseudalkalibacillus caeni]TLS35115.1 transcription-repair coupling factor [Pseudalkalibacillus caeni]